MKMKESLFAGLVLLFVSALSAQIYTVEIDRLSVQDQKLYNEALNEESVKNLLKHENVEIFNLASVDAKIGQHTELKTGGISAKFVLRKSQKDSKKIKIFMDLSFLDKSEEIEIDGKKYSQEIFETIDFKNELKLKVPSFLSAQPLEGERNPAVDSAYHVYCIRIVESSAKKMPEPTNAEAATASEDNTALPEKTDEIYKVSVAQVTKGMLKEMEESAKKNGSANKLEEFVSVTTANILGELSVPLSAEGNVKLGKGFKDYKVISFDDCVDAKKSDQSDIVEALKKDSRFGGNRIVLSLEKSKNAEDEFIANLEYSNQPKTWYLKKIDGEYYPIYSNKLIYKLAGKIKLNEFTPIYQEEEVKTVYDQEPILGDLPLIGGLWRSKGETRQVRSIVLGLSKEEKPESK